MARYPRLLSLRYTPPSLVKPDSDEIAEMLNSHSSLVKPGDEISEMLLERRDSHFRLVKPDSDGIFEIGCCQELAL